MAKVGAVLDEIPEQYRQILSPILLAQANSKTWQTTRHHVALDREVRQFLADDSDLLIVTAPPRHGKSEFLAHWLPTHYLGMHPDRNVMICSYAANLAKYHNRRVKNTYHSLAPLFGNQGVDPMAAKADDWRTPEGGGSLSSGVQGGVTGRGGHLILIDDYIRSAKDANSESIRANIWEWFRATVSTRREPNAKIIVLATPWHRKDLIGMLRTEAETLDLNCRLIQFKAIYDGDGYDPLGREIDEALWPERFPVDKLLKQKKLMGGYWWEAQYMGNPTLSGDVEWSDDLFKDIWLQDDEWPATKMVSAAYLDPSKGANERSDYQALVYVGYHNGHFLVDSDIDRRSVTRMTRNMARRCVQWRPTVTGIEANAFQDLLAPDYRNACEEEGYHVDQPELLSNTVNKNVRIRRLGQFLEDRRFKFRRNRSNELLVEQLREFPNGDHDDGPDALEGAMRLMCKLANIPFGDPEDLVRLSDA